MKRLVPAALAAFLTGFLPVLAQEAGSAGPEAAEVAQRMTQGRAMEAAIWGMPAVNTQLMLQEAKKIGAKPHDVVYWGRPLDWHNQTLTPNPDAIYLMSFYDLSDGPVVFEVPPAEDGAFVQRQHRHPLADAARGRWPDGCRQGRGRQVRAPAARPPSQLPEGFTPLQSDTLTGYALFRSNLKSHGDADVAASVDYGKKWQVYPLSLADDPPPTKFIDAADASSTPPFATT